MSSSPSADSSAPHLRKPLGSSKGAGSDMSMMFFAQPDCPARFAHHDEHRIRGLNAEAIARVLLPPIVDTDWSEQWFLMSGRVHPYALAWEVERRDGLEAGPDDTVLYTVPALIVRDQGYQPVLPRSLASGGQFPSTPPVVSFHGVIAGPGLDLLRGDFLPGLGPDQLRCCGFVFVIFPIYANPWAVVGLLDHRLMLCPPGSERDYVFIVVPDSWNFVDRPSAAASASASPLATPLKRQTLSASSTFDSVRAALYSVAAPASAASAPPSLASAPTALDPVTPPPKRSHPALADTPMKRARLLQQQNSPPSSSSDTVSSAAPSSSPPPAASSSRPSGVPPVPLRQPSRVPLLTLLSRAPPTRPLDLSAIACRNELPTINLSLSYASCLY
ncbi:uncharacterized protein HRG_08818 [Hirsutella rhossiliensis]|uniref:Uncharacterized protein n=1 Tax=Hirsutella rhossiliensis TaxID=111463 RepID=A0A9P8MRL7_9HYPO|nr:uncharacterized protein HRG_08818 [Hirsutella rhossiliensis]KAH0959797.1 hypothetical protein HRG_08818 [Hirsutella rhossiliensis]